MYTRLSRTREQFYALYCELFPMLANFAKPYPRLTARTIRERYPKARLVGAEIGTFSGFHAKQLVCLPQVQKLHLIDPYEVYDEYKESWVSSSSMQFVERTAHARLGKRKVVWHRKRSSAAAPEFDDASLDFVYVDGNHGYEFVRSDIADFWPKLRAGGFLAGDDFDWPGVRSAVIEFVTREGITDDLLVRSNEWRIDKRA